MQTQQLNGQVTAGAAPAAPAASSLEPSWFINRELSWLDFNDRVLEEARDPSNPLLERLRFLAICASNLDEFFEVRVAGLQAQIYENLEPQDPPPDGMGPLAQLIEISRRAHDFVGRMYEVWHTEVRPQLLKHGIRVCSPRELNADQNAYLDDFFDSQVYPVLTPLAIDPAHPFPHVHNKSLNLLLRIESDKPHARPLYAVLQVPSVLNRLVPLPDEADGNRRFVLLEDVIGPRLDALFGGYRVTERVAFRVTRNSDLTIQENEVRSSLLSTIEETLRQRKWGGRRPPGDLRARRRRIPGTVALDLGPGAGGPRRLQGPRAGQPDRPVGPLEARGVPRPARALLRAADARGPSPAARACSPPSATRTSWSTTPMSRSARSSSSSSKPRKIPRSWRSR